MSSQIIIQKQTMDFEGGIVPLGARYYAVKSTVGNQYYTSADDIPVSDLLLRAGGLANLAWPDKAQGLKDLAEMREIGSIKIGRATSRITQRLFEAITV